MTFRKNQLVFFFELTRMEGVECNKESRERYLHFNLRENSERNSGEESRKKLKLEEKWVKSLTAV